MDNKLHYGYLLKLCDIFSGEIIQIFKQTLQHSKDSESPRIEQQLVQELFCNMLEIFVFSESDLCHKKSNSSST
jgi:hypothetical protein